MIPIPSSALVNASVVSSRLPRWAGEAVKALDNFICLAGWKFVAALGISHVPLVGSTSTTFFSFDEVPLSKCRWAFHARGDSRIVYLVASASPTSLSLYNWPSKLSDWALDARTLDGVIHLGAVIAFLVDALSAGFC